MFTDIVTSTDLVGVIGDDAWSELLRWHNRELRAAIAEHRGQEVNHTGDGFFVAFDDSASAIECAVAIQRALAEHRRNAGFAPEVRIGVNAAEATQHAAGYRGQGVHVTARIAAAAGAGEILATRQTIDSIALHVSWVARAELRPRGFAQPVEVVSVDWQEDVDASGELLRT
jgi:class 3 adenylate cyclase